MNDFDDKLNEIHDRVLNKALTEEEQNSYTESLFESIKHINKYGQEFGMPEKCKMHLNIANGAGLRK